MPHLHVQLYPGRDKDTKKQLVSELEECLKHVLNSTSDSISISLEEIKPENWQQEVVEKQLVQKKEQVMKFPNYK